MYGTEKKGGATMREHFNASGAKSRAKQINAIALNIFERGADGVEPDNELVGIILDLSCYLVNWFKESGINE